VDLLHKQKGRRVVDPAPWLTVVYGGL
jgi:hypothetical protein